MYNGYVISDKERNNKTYDGKTFKFGVTIEGENYIVKYPKKTLSSLYSEYVASRFIRGIGVPCQEVYLGYYNNSLVVIMKDFTSNDVTLKPFESTKQSYESEEVKSGLYTYDYVISMIKHHKKLSEKEKSVALRRFWDMFICDAILGNRDRHPGNWGYLSYGSFYIAAPLYDNGASLFPDVESKVGEYISLLNSNREYKFIEERAEKFPASKFQIETNRVGKKYRLTNYNEILGDLRINRVLAEEVKELKEKVGFKGVFSVAYNILCDESISLIIPVYLRRFYLIIICVRYLHIIERISISRAYRVVLEVLKNEESAR